MTKSLEHLQTLEHLLRRAKFFCNHYQTTIFMDDILDHHYLLSAFVDTTEYLNEHIVLEIHGTKYFQPIFTDILQDDKDGHVSLTFIFNHEVIKDYFPTE